MTTTRKTRTYAEGLDLVLTRHVPAPPRLVWEAWTDPEHLKQWFTPKPVEVTECRIDLKPGGEFHTTMRLPDGTIMPNNGCFLEIVEHERLVFTDALEPGWRPASRPFMTAIITMEEQADGSTLYTARAMHKDEESLKAHEEMGFHDGWGTVAEQMVDYLADLQARET